MKRKILKIVIPALVIGLLGFLIYGIVTKLNIKSAAEEKIKEVPDFKFYTLSNNGFTNENIPANKAVVIIHFSPDCENCQDEASDLQKDIGLLPDVEILMVSEAKKEEVAKFMMDYKLDSNPQIIALLDKDHVFFKAFGQVLNPLVYIYNKEHKLVRHYVGQTRVEAISKALKQ
jgi:thiol-disulfide isomerase/thioredoxin